MLERMHHRPIAKSSFKLLMFNVSKPATWLMNIYRIVINILLRGMSYINSASELLCVVWTPI